MPAYRLLFLLPFWFVCQALPAQTLHYDVYKGDNKVGSMEVVMEVKGDSTLLWSRTKMEISMLFTVELDFRYEAVYHDGQLQRSFTQNYRGGDLKGESRGHREGKAYLTRVDEEWKRLDPAPIDYSILSTYFASPQGRSRVFSERWGTYLPLNQLADGRYELEIPDGSRNTFTYQNGRCTALQVNHLLATLDFRLRQ